MSFVRSLGATRFAIILSLVILPTIGVQASQNPRYYIQSNPLPTDEYVVGLANRLSSNHFIIYGQDLASAFELSRTKASLITWAKGIRDGVVIIWNPNRIEQSVVFSSLMRTIDSLGKIAVVMVGFHSPSAEIMKVNPIHEHYTANCNLILNWVNPTKK